MLIAGSILLGNFVSQAWATCDSEQPRLVSALVRSLQSQSHADAGAHPPPQEENFLPFQPWSDDLYARLAANRSMTHDEIKKLFRKAALLFHPDKTVLQEIPPILRAQMDDAFKKISEAWEVLGDGENRSQYDATGTLPHAAGRSSQHRGPFAASSWTDYVNLVHTLTPNIEGGMFGGYFHLLWKAQAIRMLALNIGDPNFQRFLKEVMTGRVSSLSHEMLRYTAAHLTLFYPALTGDAFDLSLSLLFQNAFGAEKLQDTCLQLLSWLQEHPQLDPQHVAIPKIAKKLKEKLSQWNLQEDPAHETYFLIAAQIAPRSPEILALLTKLATGRGDLWLSSHELVQLHAIHALGEQATTIAGAEAFLTRMVLFQKGSPLSTMAIAALRPFVVESPTARAVVMEILRYRYQTPKERLRAAAFALGGTAAIPEVKTLLRQVAQDHYEDAQVRSQAASALNPSP